MSLFLVTLKKRGAVALLATDEAAASAAGARLGDVLRVERVPPGGWVGTMGGAVYGPDGRLERS